MNIKRRCRWKQVNTAIRVRASKQTNQQHPDARPVYDAAVALYNEMETRAKTQIGATNSVHSTWPKSLGGGLEAKGGGLRPCPPWDEKAPAPGEEPAVILG